MKRTEMFYNILGVLTNDKERQRYNKHLAEYGSDENFQPRFESSSFKNPHYFASLAEKVLKKYKEKRKKIGYRRWELFFEEQEELIDFAEKIKEWKCAYCGGLYKKLIIYSKADPIPRWCLTCFAFLWGRQIGSEDLKAEAGWIDQYIKDTFKMVKEVEKKWELSFSFQIIVAN